ncbi:MAG: hypothetical protein P8Y01_00310 [Woeseiaceae bacterium]|jgi:adenylate cyclase
MKLWFANFLAELRRRRVIKAAVAYVVTAWLLIEGSSVMFPALLLPDWTHRLVVVLSIIAFPIVVVLAWIFDLTSQGLERTLLGESGADAERESSGTSVASGVDSSASRGLPPSLDTAFASIAVVPFEALSDESDDIYLARGISAEISMALAQLSEIRVVRWRSPPRDSNSTEVDRKAGVDFVLTGSVRRRGEQIRIIADLEDVQKGRLVWSEAYDRVVDDIMDLEREIAEGIAGSFGGENLRDQISRSVGTDTDSLDAWSLVQKARAFILDYGSASLASAERYARDAIVRDPGYAAAHAALASVLAEKVTGGLSESAESDLAEAAREIDEAIDHRPNDPLILKLAGNVWSYAGEFDKARAALRRAVNISPYDFGAWGYLGFTLAVSGTDSDLAEAHAILDRILDLAPQHPGYAYWMHNKALACAAGQLFAESADFARGAVERQPALAWAWYLLANSLAMTGCTDEARIAIATARKANPALSPEKYVAFVNRTSGNKSVEDSRMAGLRAEQLL